MAEAINMPPESLDRSPSASAPPPPADDLPPPPLPRRRDRRNDRFRPPSQPRRPRYYSDRDRDFKRCRSPRPSYRDRCYSLSLSLRTKGVEDASRTRNKRVGDGAGAGKRCGCVSVKLRCQWNRKVVGVEPADRSVISGDNSGFIPSILDVKLLDEVTKLHQNQHLALVGVYLASIEVLSCLKMLKHYCVQMIGFVKLLQLR